MNLTQNYFDSEEFVDLINKYLGMAKNHTQVFFEREELLALADYYLNNDRKSDSLDVLNYALKLYPNDDDIRLGRVNLLFETNHYDEAAEALESMTDCTAPEMDLFYMKKNLHEENFEKADEIADKRMQDSETPIDDIRAIIAVYFCSSCSSRAEKWLKRYKELTQGNEKETLDMNFFIRQKYMEIGKMDKTIDNLHQDLEEHPYAINLWIESGAYYTLLDDMEKAHEALDYALAIDPENVDALKLMADVALGQKNYSLGIQTLTKILEKEDATEEYIDKLFCCYADSNKYKEAKDFCNDLMKKLPAEDADVDIKACLCYKLSIVESLEGNLKEGLEWIEKATELNEYVVAYQCQKAVILQNLNKDKEAIQVLCQCYKRSYADREIGQVFGNILRSFLKTGELKRLHQWTTEAIPQIKVHLYELEIAEAYYCYTKHDYKKMFEHVSIAIDYNSQSKTYEDDWNDTYYQYPLNAMFDMYMHNMNGGD